MTITDGDLIIARLKVQIDALQERLALAEQERALWQQRFGDAQAEITRLWARLETRTAEANRLELEAAYLREQTEVTKASTPP